MPYGARAGLAALILCLTAVGAAAQQPSGTTWTDPPARKPEAGKPAAAQSARAAPAPRAAPSETPAAGPKAVARAAEPVSRPARRAVAERRARARPSRIARRARPERFATVRPVRPPRMVAAMPPGPRAGYGYRPYGYDGYRPYGYGPGYGPRYEDERLERLRAAQEAGYLVVRRRWVEFPDGRALPIYRPYEGGGPF